MATALLERMDTVTVKTNHGLVQWAIAWLGQKYWFGCCCYPCTKSLLARKAQQYPTHYRESRMARYKADIAAGRKCADCVGLVKGYYWTREDGSQKYGLDGRPDKGANGMFSASKVNGPISTLPEIPGLLLYSPGHCGVYIGDGYAIEARGFDYGIVKTKVSQRSWTHWYQCPYIDYDYDGEEIPIVPIPPRNLSYSGSGAQMYGDDVREVQQALTVCRYEVGKVDGYFGPKTAAAVKAFQKDHGLEVDGVVGSKTRQALEAAKQAAEAQGDDPEDEPPENPPSPGEDTPGVDYGKRLLKYVKGRRMQSGDDVRNVQYRLKALGYDPEKMDGIYGPLTQAAVLAFQEARGIKGDGIVGPDTRAQLSK